MNAAALLAKSEVAAASAQALLERGDADGAVNRAYDAMFDAARAILTAALGEMEAGAAARTHSGLIAAFGLHIVKPGRMPREYGRQLNRALELRQLADYTGESIDMAEAAELVQQARRFVQAVRQAVPKTDEV
ncbi:HEPN domain protein [Tepidimonas alkaliphilus]|uniref:HEPN domain protein n=1 Tax=Tepidimonas alkaliphilus TaxID=2588942 RepID=A0A554WBC5_9BURK|nr:HEPN domain-containing protein [Tepidimonas alkaliphilus]TSE20877.1 HEPN domain protein [Tepidimonas alkaliphilus]